MTMSKKPIALLGALTLSVIQGCNSFIPAKFELPRPQGVFDRVDLKDADPVTIARDYAVERMNRPTPQVGLALSGGGTRAGLFAFGVLQGLNDTRLLDKVDVISSVSGGGYAAYWLYARRLENIDGGDYREAFADCRPDWWTATDDDEIYKSLMRHWGAGDIGFAAQVPCHSPDTYEWSGREDKYRWEAHIGQHTDIFRRQPQRFIGTNGLGPFLASIPVAGTVVVDTLFNPVISDGYLGRKYEEGISRVWGLTPDIRTDRNSLDLTYSAADRDLFGGPFVRAGDHTWAKMRELDIKSRNSNQPLPLWIVNATVAPQGKETSTNEVAIFELTPFSYGSMFSGYRTTDTAPDILPELPGSVRASAAAGDGQNTPSMARWLFSGFFPSARWGVPVKNDPLGSKNPGYRLSDGGGSDNLALISLVRRGVKDIILVDAEADIEGRFKGLCVDMAILNKAGYELRFAALPDLKVLCEQHGFNSVAKSLTRNGTKRAYNVNAWVNPVIEGEIVPSGLTISQRAQDKLLPKMRVWFIKLAWNQEKYAAAKTAKECETAKHPVSCMVTLHLANQENQNELLKFPHISTMGAGFNSSTTLFWAWRELGRTASSLLELTDKGLAISQGPRIPPVQAQPLLYWNKGKHASTAP